MSGRRRFDRHPPDDSGDVLIAACAGSWPLATAAQVAPDGTGQLHVVGIAEPVRILWKRDEHGVVTVEKDVRVDSERPQPGRSRGSVSGA